MITEKNLNANFDETPISSYKDITLITSNKGPSYHLVNLCLNKKGKVLKYISDSKKYKGKDASFIEDTANKAQKCQNKININEDVITFITKWSCGTVHGYFDIFQFINCYLGEIDKYKDHKILVYKNTSQGILDILNHLSYMNVVDKNKIIYIESEKVYKIKSVSKFKTEDYGYHNYDWNDDFFKNTKLFINKYLLNKIDYLNPVNCCIENVAIIKENYSETNVSKRNDGFDEDEINLFCEKYNYTLVKPESVNEVTLINILNNCKKFLASWGTVSIKNTVYLSENCKSINVIVKKKSAYSKEYEKYLLKYNKYLDSDRTEKRSEWMKNIYDPPRVKYHLVKDLKDVAL